MTGEGLDAVDPAGAETNRVAGLGDAGMASAIALKMSSIFSLDRLAPRVTISEFSAQTLSVLAALCDQPSQWQHGYALARQTGLKSGTLYPILIRLADRGLVEAC